MSLPEKVSNLKTEAKIETRTHTRSGKGTEMGFWKCGKVIWKSTINIKYVPVLPCSHLQKPFLWLRNL